MKQPMIGNSGSDTTLILILIRQHQSLVDNAKCSIREWLNARLEKDQLEVIFQ